MQNQSRSDQSREKKREQFSGNTKPKKTKWMIIAALVAVALAVYVVFNASSDKPSSSTVATTNQAAGGEQASDIRIPISEISTKAKFFDYNTADKRSVRFFVIKSSDGVYRAALDACDTCFHSKKGYHQEGDDMVCNNCGLKFHSALINEVAGGCNPIGVPRAIEGDQIVIKAGDLERGGRYF